MESTNKLFAQWLFPILVFPSVYVCICVSSVMVREWESYAPVTFQAKSMMSPTEVMPKLKANRCMGTTDQRPKIKYDHMFSFFSHKCNNIFLSNPLLYLSEKSWFSKTVIETNHFLNIFKFSEAAFGQHFPNPALSFLSFNEKAGKICMFCGSSSS